MKNEGKVFEKDFKNSVPKEIYIERLKDSTQSFYKNEKVKFTPTNPYDFFIFKFPRLYCFELKSTIGKSMSFWTNGDENKKMIKKHQIEGLTKASQFDGIVAGFILNWRENNNTYFLNIKDFNRFVKESEKKTLNENDIIQYNGVLLKQNLLVTHYRYDVYDLLSRI